MQDLRANTEVVVRIGPVVDYSDGVTPVTDLALASADQAKLLKHGSGSVVDISGATWAAITGCDGWYNLTLTTAHVNTEGMLDIVIQDADVCLPVYRHFMVLSQAAYDSMYGEDDDGRMQVNIADVASSVDTGFGILTALKRILAVLDGTVSGKTDRSQAQPMRNKAGTVETTHTIDQYGNRTVS